MAPAAEPGRHGGRTSTASSTTRLACAAPAAGGRSAKRPGRSARPGRCRRLPRAPAIARRRRARSPSRSSPVPQPVRASDAPARCCPPQFAPPRRRQHRAYAPRPARPRARRLRRCRRSSLPRGQRTWLCPVPSVRGYRGAGRGKVAKTVVPHSSDSMRSSWVSLLERRSPSPKPPPFVNDGFAPRPSSATETKRWPGVDRAVTSTRPGSTPRVGVLDGVSNQLADHRLDGEGVGPVVARDLGELSPCPRHGARCRGHSQAEELAGHGVLLPGAAIH